MRDFFTGVRLFGQGLGILLRSPRLLLVGALPAGFFVLAGVLGVVFVVESVAGWTGTVRMQQTAVYEEQEDEGQ